MMDGSPVDWTPLARLAAVALALAALPLGAWWLRHRRTDTRARLGALTALTLFLTFDLIVFGAFTRLTDSGLGCPDWPGCYGAASPLGARADIGAAEAALPSGAVTWSKAWIEMIHRYLAMAVGVSIIVMAVASWRVRGKLPHSAWWATATLLWVLVQGLFGAWTVTLKLYPAIVTAHLLGGLLLLALLAAQHESYRERPVAASAKQRTAVLAVLALVVLQAALGGWVSTNYAVLACSGFPQCNGQWWPAGMDWDGGFTVLRALGRAGDGGGYLSFDALLAIHMAHRVAALVVLAALGALALALIRSEAPALRRFGIGLGVLALAQLASGLSNVVLGWPIVAALAHSAGAAALVLLLVLLLARVWARSPLTPALSPAGGEGAMRHPLPHAGEGWGEGVS